MNPFRILSRDGKARRGEFSTPHGTFETPNFMPVGTQGSVKGMAPDRLRACGAQILLANTYHLHLRPGDELIERLGGLHRFMGWDGPILTDSGGFQVFSLAGLRTIDEDGVSFRSHIDGSAVRLTPERVVRIQERLGVDIMMAFDECPPYPADRSVVAAATERTHRWAARALAVRENKSIALFGIVQGGVYPDLREGSVEAISALAVDGIALGGVSVGEPVSEMRAIVERFGPQLPDDRIHYLMGVGTPADLLHAVQHGIDLFDCVIPTRAARFGRVYVRDGFLNLRNACFRDDSRPLDPGCDCYTCQTFSRAYVSHLIRAREVLAIELATLHNLRFYERLMEEVREAISTGSLSRLVESYG
ncbi:MAG: tRNA guanosine(34) transglycosylase Tgt [Bdellovibrionales bacterium]|nr:tRNA guanosine(34) transglycosylase Tgt [Bdellovibrionales bacterium]